MKAEHRLHQSETRSISLKRYTSPKDNDAREDRGGERARRREDAGGPAPGNNERRLETQNHHADFRGDPPASAAGSARLASGRPGLVAIRPPSEWAAGLRETRVRQPLETKVRWTGGVAHLARDTPHPRPGVSSLSRSRPSPLSLRRLPTTTPASPRLHQPDLSPDNLFPFSPLPTNLPAPAPKKHAGDWVQAAAAGVMC